MKNEDRLKFEIQAPCVFADDKGKPDAPEIDCLWQCKFCGWNTKEQQRRMREGKWIKGQLHFKGGYRKKC